MCIAQIDLSCAKQDKPTLRHVCSLHLGNISLLTIFYLSSSLDDEGTNVLSCVFSFDVFSDSPSFI